MHAHDAFVLLTLENTTIDTPGVHQSGTLSLKCITVQLPGAANPSDRDVYLVLHLNSFETPIDPARVIRRTDGSGLRTYTFLGSESDPVEFTITVVLPTYPDDTKSHRLEDLETFEGILAQYAELQDSPSLHAPHATASAPGGSDLVGSALPGAHGDLRGQLVAINEDTGEVIGQFDDKQFRIQEDPRLNERGHENDPVIIEVPEQSTREQDATALDMFVRVVPPDQQDWMTKSATIVSHAISKTTDLLLTTITTASTYYVAHSTPSPHHPQNASAGASSNIPPPPPPRALVLLTSDKTRKGLANVHAVSGRAVQVSSKTVNMIDNMIRRAMGGKPKRNRMFTPPSSNQSPPGSLSPGYPGGSLPVVPPPLPPRTPSPSPSKGYLSPSYHGSPPAYPADKPPLPPRRSPSPVLPPIPGRPSADTTSGPIANAPPPRLRKRDRLLLSVDLILSTIDHSTRRILDKGTETVGTVVGHKYGPEAAQSSLHIAGTARNVGLVYVDMRGIGRRALLRRAGKEFVKARLSSGARPELQQGMQNNHRRQDIQL